MNKNITIEIFVEKDIETVWKVWTGPEYIMQWAFASDDWECPHAENDVRVGGKCMTRMSAKDGSQSFDIHGVYTEVEIHQLLAYTMEDGRKVFVTFTETPNGVHIAETFEIENENSEELQQNGWLAILNNFKKVAEQQYSLRLF